MEKIKGIIQFLFKNFGPLLVFYLANRFWGLKTAIVVSLIFTVGEIIHTKFAKQELTMFFKFSVVMALIFGTLDLTLESAFFYKIEATLTNLFTAFFFGITLFQPKPLFGIMFFGSIVLARPLWNILEKIKWMPSSRVTSEIQK